MAARPQPKPKAVPAYFRCDYDPEFHPSAIQALLNGTANEHQQKKAMEWIIRTAGAFGEQPFTPGDPHATAFMAGRMFVAQQIQKMSALNPRAFALARNKENGQ